MPPHICFISSAIYRQLRQTEGKAAGGAERQQHMIATELQNRGYTISMIVGDFGQPTYEEIEGIEVWNGCPGEINTLASIPKKAFKLFRTMKRVDADAYYVRGAPRLFSVVSLFCRILNKRLIFCIANESDVDPEYLDERYNWIYRRLYRAGLNSVDDVVTQTKQEQEMLKTQFEVESTVIPNSYDLPGKGKVLDHASREFVLWVGRSNEHQKKPMRYLKLAKRLPEIPFVMIARPSNDGSHHREVRNKARSIDNLDFVGTVAPDKIHDYYNNASVLVNTSDYEGFPNTFLEAWRYQTPVISLHYTLDERLNREHIGVHSGSMEQLAADVSELHTDVDARGEMGRKGREYVKEHYLLENVVDKYETLLRNGSDYSVSGSTS